MTKHEAIWHEIETRIKFGHLDIDERWLDIPGYEGYYQVSNIGRVKSLARGLTKRTRILRAGPGNTSGHLRVGLCKHGKCKSVFVHKLVAEAWIGPCPTGKQVRHGPGLILDNTVPNLCYGTPMQDLEDRRRDGTSTERAVRCSDGVEYISIATASRARGIDYSQLRQACRGRGQTAGGFGWEYILEEGAHA